MIFLNYTNHSSDLWSKEQLKAANEYGTIADMPFPAVDPEYGEEQISEPAAAEADKIIAIKPNAVLCQGEMSLAHSVINILKLQYKPKSHRCQNILCVRGRHFQKFCVKANPIK